MSRAFSAAHCAACRAFLAAIPGGRDDSGGCRIPLCTFFPLLPERLTKTWLEPPLVIGASLLLVEWHEGFASHLFWAGVALWVTELADDLGARQELRQIRDGYIEQDYRGRQFGGPAS